MECAKDHQPDLTTTIHRSSLRPIEGHSINAVDRLDDEARSIIKGLPQESAMLISIAGPGRGARYLLDREVTSLGRAVDSDIFLDDITVSRTHALIRRNGKSFEVEDQGSLNGTYIDGALVTKAILNEGCELQIGKFRVIFFNGGKP